MAANRTLSKQVIKALLEPIVQGSYSVALYGAPQRTPIRHIKLVYLDRLPSSALERIKRIGGGVCLIHAKYLLMPLYVPQNPMFDLVDVAWVRQHLYVSKSVAVPNHSWVEVTHCGAAQADVICKKTHCGTLMRRQQNASGAPGPVVPLGQMVPPAWAHGPAWFYHAPGSGVSINVGRTRVMSGFSEAREFLKSLYTHSSYCDNETVYWRNANETVGPLSWDARPPNLADHVALDSIQITDHREYFSAEHRHEIVMLRWANCLEVRAWALRGLVRCGRHPWLRTCGARAEDDNLLSHMESCTAGAVRSMSTRIKEHVLPKYETCGASRLAGVRHNLKEQCALESSKELGPDDVGLRSDSEPGVCRLSHEINRTDPQQHVQHSKHMAGRQPRAGEP